MEERQMREENIDRETIKSLLLGLPLRPILWLMDPMDRCVRLASLYIII